MKPYVITQLQDCLYYARDVVGEQLLPPRNILYVCTLRTVNEASQIRAVVRVDLTVCDDQARIREKVSEFVVDTEPDELVMCWYIKNSLENARTPDVEYAAETRLIAQIYTQVKESLQHLPAYRKLKPTLLVTDNCQWTEIAETQVHNDTIVLGELNSLSESVKRGFDCAPGTWGESNPIEGIWQRVSFNRRKRSIEIEQEVASGSLAANGMLLWANTMKKVASSADSLLPNQVTETLGGHSRIGKLNGTLHDSHTRDRVLLWAISGVPFNDDVAWADCYQLMRTTPMSEELVVRTRKTITVLNACASFSAEDSACAYATLAYLYWWVGQVTLARQATELARESDPSYRLSQLIEAILEGGILPPWALEG